MAVELLFLLSVEPSLKNSLIDDTFMVPGECLRSESSSMNLISSNTLLYSTQFMLFSLSAAVLTSPIVCDNFRGDSFTPKMVILFKFESLAGDGTRAVWLLLLLLLFGSPVADFDLELIT